MAGKESLHPYTTWNKIQFLKLQSDEIFRKVEWIYCSGQNVIGSIKIETSFQIGLRLYILRNILEFF